MARLKGQLKAPSEPLGRVSKYDSVLLYGADAIAEYMGCSAWTVRQWIARQGFLAGKLPNGMWASSTALIDNWIMARNPYFPQTPR